MFRRRVRQFFRTLRFRLAGTFLLLLAAVLAVVGLVGTKTLQSIVETQSEQTLHDQLGAMRGYIHFDDRGNPYWFADPSDPEEEAAVGRLKTVYVEAYDNGEPYEGSTNPAIKSLFDRETVLNELAEMQVTHEPVIKTITGKDRIQYQIISSTMVDSEHNRKWYIAEGRSLAEDHLVVRRFRRNFSIFLPIAIFVCAVASWYSAGMVLRALHSVDKAAQEITGSNLGLQIARRDADDELDRLIDSFNAMSGRLKHSFEQIRQFSTDVSQELRTPLTAIQGQLEVALFTSSSKEQLREAIENALTDVERLANLVRALLLLSQSESGQIPPNKSVLNMTELIEDLVDQFQIPAEASGLELTQSGAREAVYCEADRTQIERVITNLLSNAIKYTQKGGWVRVSAENVGAFARLIVEDSGVGIPQDHLPHIFDRFYRVPDPNPEKGLGLGLSFVASIVKGHGGEIFVHSEAGKGSRFEVTLPAGHAPATLEAPLTASHSTGEPGGDRLS